MQRRVRRSNRLNDGVRGGRGIALLFAVAFVGTGARLVGSRRIVRQTVCRLDQGAAQEIGAERAGFDNGYANAERPEFGGERFGKTFDGKYGGMVNAPTGNAGETANRRKIDDVAAALLSHMRQDGAGDAKQA